MTELLDVGEVEGPDILDQTKSFHDERREGIFSTDVAAILGLSRWGSAMTVYRAKVGLSEPRQAGLAAWVGTRLEGLVAELYVAATGSKLRTDNLSHQHRQYGWARTHLDRRVVGDPGLLVELKTRGSKRGWGDDGSAVVPADVFCQCQWQMWVTGAHRCHVATLFSNSQFHVYDLLPDGDFIEKLIPTVESFWFNNVLAGQPPDISGSDVDSDLVKSQLSGRTTGEMKPATPEQEALVERLRLARMNTAQAKFAQSDIENKLKLIIGDADGLTGSFGSITWRHTKDVSKTDWERVARVYRNAVDDLLPYAEELNHDTAALRAAVDLAESIYSVVEPGPRRFVTDLRET